MRSSCSRAPFALFHFSIICTFLCLRVSATCYYPNGTADNTNTYLPCNPNGQSMCCMTNTAILDAASIDTCRSDGFCIPNDNNSIWRRLCTDQSWKDPACIDLCTNGNCLPQEVVDFVANIYIQPSTLMEALMLMQPLR